MDPFAVSHSYRQSKAPFFLLFFIQIDMLEIGVWLKNEVHVGDILCEWVHCHGSSLFVAVGYDK